ncbi:globin domain-containing protein [Chitinimonas sp.]|uniref:globin domain-containing protein n=1 Tax=Chitinimonas sp. TaxID=1934313 RepID=UPI0035B41D5F
MLSPSARPYIEASVPVLRQHGLAITQVFYQRMFAAYPELENLFNLGNQANGSQQQSLAAAVFAYAANIDKPDALAPVASRIAHKHASVGIRPAHYPIVGRYLLAAIGEVLGDAATPALLAAWDEAYWLLAGELIAAEARLSEQSGAATGEMRELQVMETRQECDGVISCYLKTPDGQSPGAFKPGQYVSVAVELAALGRRQIRQYSLSDAPSRDWWRLTIKREAGEGATPAGMVSNHLHKHVQQGDRLAVGAPFGDFTPNLDAGRPIALISAGVGITPMVSVLNTLADRRDSRPIIFAHAAQSAAHHALRADLANARDRLAGLQTHVFYEQAGATDHHAQPGRMALERVLAGVPADTDFYLCGPIPFMQAQWQALLAHGIAPQHIQREVFGPELLDHLL